MMVVAGAASARRAQDLIGASRLSTWAIACSAGPIICLMTGLRVIDKVLTSLALVGGMLIGNSCVQAPFESSLIPALDSLCSPGIVWIHGLMRGMLLSGERPVYVIYQFVVLAMIFAASGLISLISTQLIRGRIFSSAQRLLLQPGRLPI